jgi:CRP-like cAMP-binding protein
MVARYHLLKGGRRQYLSFHMSGDLPDAQGLFIERMDHALCATGAARVAFIPHTQILRAFERRPSLGIAIWRETLLDAAIFREAITNSSARPKATRMADLFCELFYRARLAQLNKGNMFDPVDLGSAWGDARHGNRLGQPCPSTVAFVR